MRLDGVIFDMDGVLVDSEEFICQAARTMFRERYGVDISPDEFLPFVGAGENAYIGGPAKVRGVELHMPEDKDRVYEIYLEQIVGRLRPLPGVTAFIEDMKSRGVSLAVASAADRVKVEGNLRAIGLEAETFQALVTGSCVTRHKPDPQCFQMAAEGMGIPPNRCLVVEDAINGCKAAKAAGATCLGLTTSFSREELQQAGTDYLAPHLGEVPSELRDRLGKD
jgi:HAD superfamily hydrolase (TIGR01509 family)